MNSIGHWLSRNSKKMPLWFAFWIGVVPGYFAHDIFYLSDIESAVLILALGIPGYILGAWAAGFINRDSTPDLE